MAIKVVGFDLFGTLITAKANWETCLREVYVCLQHNGLEASYETFVEISRMIQKKQRESRQVRHREITNNDIVCEAAKQLGCDLKPTSDAVKKAVQAYFKPWLIELREDALFTLETLSPIVSLGLVSNFTDTQFIAKCLTKCRIKSFFDSIIISAACGWRKPSLQIFEVFLRSFDVRPEDCLFVGDELESDVKGAKQAGIPVAHLSLDQRQPHNTSTEANYVIHSLEELIPIVKNKL